jgi:hypothetical protein
METVDWVSRHADPDVRAKLPPLNLVKFATATFDSIHEAVQSQIARAARGEVATDVVHGTKGWNAYGAFDPAERTRALDDLGFARQLVFSTFSGGQYLNHPGMDVRYGGIRAHNRAMAAFCGEDRRLIAVGQVSLLDPRRAVEEIVEGIRLGCGTFWIPGCPVGDSTSGKSPGHPDYDPVWRTLSERNVPFMLHVGPNNPTKHPAYENNAKPRPKDITGAEQGENLRVRDFMLLSIAPQQFLTALVFDGVFDRFAALRGGIIELGAGCARVPAHARSEPADLQALRRDGRGAAHEGFGVRSPRGEVPPPSREKTSGGWSRTRGPTSFCSRATTLTSKAPTIRSVASSGRSGPSASPRRPRRSSTARTSRP